jgi:3-methyladenine DNA glycosylase AlkD
VLTVLSHWQAEVEGALRAIGNPRYGEAVRADRRSELEYLGVGFPEVRGRVKQGFSFYREPPERILAVWDELWRTSRYGEALFAALEYYRKAPKRRPAAFWTIAQGWITRVDNWAHADALAGVYSELLEESFEEVFPVLKSWNAADGEWQRRVSLVSLIHYTGKNAVFLPPETVLPMVSNCLEDSRYYVQTAVGWVLREVGNRHPEELRAYLSQNGDRMTATAFSRAIERLSADERAAMRAARKARA